MERGRLTCSVASSLAKGTPFFSGAWMVERVSTAPGPSMPWALVTSTRNSGWGWSTCTDWRRTHTGAGRRSLLSTCEPSVASATMPRTPTSRFLVRAKTTSCLQLDTAAMQGTHLVLQKAVSSPTQWSLVLLTKIMTKIPVKTVRLPTLAVGGSTGAFVPTWMACMTETPTSVTGWGSFGLLPKDRTRSSGQKWLSAPLLSKSWYN